MSVAVNVWVPRLGTGTVDDPFEPDLASAGYDPLTHSFTLVEEDPVLGLCVRVRPRDPWHMVQGLAQLALNNRVDGVVQAADLDAFLQGVVDLKNVPQ